MDAGTLRRSAAAIRPYFAALVAAGRRDAGMDELRAIGLRAEAAMLAATGGVNAHRGAIFSLGLICAGAGVAGPVPASAEARAEAVARLWGGPSLARRPRRTAMADGPARRYGVGGASAEAAAGFPTIRAVGLPALRLGRVHAPDDPRPPGCSASSRSWPSSTTPTCSTAAARTADPGAGRRHGLSRRGGDRRPRLARPRRRDPSRLRGGAPEPGGLRRPARHDTVPRRAVARSLSRAAPFGRM